jgi:hypothetical protein
MLRVEGNRVFECPAGVVDSPKAAKESTHLQQQPGGLPPPFDRLPVSLKRRRKLLLLERRGILHIARRRALGTGRTDTSRHDLAKRLSHSSNNRLP